MNAYDHATQSRLLAKLVRELLRCERFESLADLTDAIKHRCARLRIAWQPDDISDAYRLIASNTDLVGPARAARVAPEPQSEPALFSPREAAQLWADLQARYARERGVA